MARILVVEDQAELQRALRINLRARQYDVLAASTGQEALDMAASGLPDTVILDLGLPDIDGIEVIIKLRDWCQAPIIVLSGRTSPSDKICALEVGADYYVTKPFAMAELLARLRAALRRHGDATPGQPPRPIIGRWQVDLTMHQITRAHAADHSEPAETLRLTPIQWGILELLLRRPGQLVGSAQILASVWGPGFMVHRPALRPDKPGHHLPGLRFQHRPLLIGQVRGVAAHPVMAQAAR